MARISDPDHDCHGKLEHQGPFKDCVSMCEHVHIRWLFVHIWSMIACIELLPSTVKRTSARQHSDIKRM